MGDQLPISYEQMRSLVVEVLSQSAFGQFDDLRTSVAKVADDRGHVAPEVKQAGVYGSQRRYSGPDWSRLSDKDYARVQSIMWDLLIEGVVRPGLNDGTNDNLPFFHVTEFGQDRIKHGAESPYDPDGYVRRLTASVPTLDSVIVTYLNESLHTFRIGCLLSSIITLGCAAEKALVLLITAYTEALPNGMQEKFRKNTEGRLIKRQFDEFSKMLESHLKGLLPGDVKEDLDITVSGLFALFRNSRNDAGHPTGKAIERERVYAYLVVFPSYVKKVYDLIG